MEDTSKIPLDRVIELPDELKSIKEAINTLLKPGDICYSLRTEKEGWLLMDGREVSRTEYADLFAVISTAYGVGDGETTFNLPNCSGKFLQMNTEKAVGTNISAGLPNITGTVPRVLTCGNSSTTIDAGTGAFSEMAQVSANKSAAGNSSSGWWNDNRNLKFNASKSNTIYGNSDTVQPPAIIVNYFIKY